MNTTLLTADNVSVYQRQQPIIDNVSVSVGRGEIITLIGPNGAGKTTLVRVVLGLLQPDQGLVIRQPGLRIGYMPQRLHIDHNMPLTVAQFLGLAVRDNNRINNRLHEVGVAYLADRLMYQISGGEIQRVLLARALLREPELLVLDEPAQGVDIKGQAALYNLILAVKKHYDCSVLMVSHDLHLVMSATDRVICLNKHVCCQGSPEYISSDPVFQELFNYPDSGAVAVYTHHHDHDHDMHGDVIKTSRPVEHTGNQ